MEVVSDVGALRERVRGIRCRGGSIGLVPTMGYLHDGHVRLAAEARAENDYVIASIYLNPTQFGPNEDLASYPRELSRDEDILRTAGVDVLFLPDTETMYPDGPTQQTIWVEPGSLAEHLCGASRPGHFQAVATVVAKLFNMVQPDRAYFGQKDAQQAAIIARMVRDLAFPLEIRIVETVREKDGLALSSRNVYLSREERPQAAALSRALAAGRAAIQSGERDARQVEAVMRARITKGAPRSRIDYVAVVDPVSLQPVDRIDREALLAVAVYFGTTRLIDNTLASTDRKAA